MHYPKREYIFFKECILYIQKYKINECEKNKKQFSKRK